MQALICRGLAVAFMVLGLAACAESLAPPGPHATRSSPAFSSTGSIDGSVLCPPCPPGMICAAVCEPIGGIEVLPPAEGDTQETDVTIVSPRAWASKAGTVKR